MINANSSSPNPDNAPDQDVDQDLEAPDPKQPQLNASDRLKRIGELMRGEDPPDGQDDQGQPPPDRSGRKPRQVKNLVEAAKALGMPVEELYNLEIPLRVPNGEKKAIRLAELKDYHDAQDDHKLERIAWEETRTKEHADIARSRAELAELLAMVPEDKLKPEVLNKIRQRHDGLVALERRKTVQRIPEWHDEDRRAEELAGIADHLADYGFPANALQGIYDHRMLAYMRDNWLRKQRLSAALEKVKPVRTGTPPRSRAAPRNAAKEPVRPQAGPRTLERQVAQVSQLLKGS